MGIFKRPLFQLAKRKGDSEPKSTNNRFLAQINQYAPLIRLQDQRQLIEVITKEHTDSFQSMIIGVDLYNQQLIIDEFSPRLQNPQALMGHPITLRHQQNQQMLKVNTHVIAWEEDSRSLLLGLPEEVHYEPRRLDLRIEIIHGRVIKATIDPTYGAPWYASVYNISPGGMRILVTGDLRNSLHKNKPLKNCDIALDNHHRIHTAGRVKSFSYKGRPFRRTEISIAFEKMTKEDRHTLEHFIHYFYEAA